MTINATGSSTPTSLSALSLGRSGNGTIIFNTGTGTLNGNAIFQFTSAQAVINGIMLPWAVVQVPGGTNADFVTATGAGPFNLATATYSNNNNLANALTTDVVKETTTDVGLTANTAAYALNTSVNIGIAATKHLDAGRRQEPRAA